MRGVWCVVVVALTVLGPWNLVAAQECAALKTAFEASQPSECDAETLAEAEAGVAAVSAACAGDVPCPSVACVLAVGASLDAFTLCQDQLETSSVTAYGLAAAGCQGCPDATAFATTAAGLQTSCGASILSGTCRTSCQTAVDALFPDLETCGSLLGESGVALLTNTIIPICPPTVEAVPAECDMTQIAPVYASTCVEFNTTTSSYVSCDASGCGGDVSQGCTFSCAASLGLASPQFAGCASRLSATEQGLFAAAGAVCPAAADGCDMTTYAGTLADLLGLGTDSEGGCFCALSTSDFLAQSTCSESCQTLSATALAGFPACSTVLEPDVIGAVLGSNAMCTESCALQTLQLGLAELEEGGKCDPEAIDDGDCAECRPVVESLSQQGVYNCNAFTRSTQETDTVFSVAALNGVCPSCEDQAKTHVAVMDHRCQNVEGQVCIGICMERLLEIQAFIATNATCAEDAAALAVIGASEYAANLAFCGAEFATTDGSCEEISENAPTPPDPICTLATRNIATSGVNTLVPAACGYDAANPLSAGVCPNMECIVEIVRAKEAVETCGSELDTTALTSYGVAAAACGGCPASELLTLSGALQTETCASALAGECSEACAAVVATVFPQGILDSCASLIEPIGGVATLQALFTACGQGTAVAEPVACDMTVLVAAAADTCVSLASYDDPDNKVYHYCDVNGCSADASLSCTLTCVAAAAGVPTEMPEACFDEGKLNQAELDLVTAVALECRGCNAADLNVAAALTFAACADWSASCDTESCTCSDACAAQLEGLLEFEVVCAAAFEGNSQLRGLLGLREFCEDDGVIELTDQVCDMTVFGSLLAEMGGLGVDPNAACLCNTVAGPLAIDSCDDDCNNLLVAATPMVPGCAAGMDALAGLVFAGSRIVCTPCELQIEEALHKMDVDCVTTDEDTCVPACRKILEELADIIEDCEGNAAVQESLDGSEYEANVEFCDNITEADFPIDSSASIFTFSMVTLSFVLLLSLAL